MFSALLPLVASQFSVFSMNLFITFLPLATDQIPCIIPAGLTFLG